VIQRAYEQANEEAMYLRGLESGYDLRAGRFLPEPDPEPMRQPAAAPRVVEDIDPWRKPEELF
jgi:hypothetical protein